MTGSYYFTLLAVLLTFTKVAQGSLPYCQGEYQNTTATCAPFNLPGGGSEVDCNPNGGPRGQLTYEHPPRGFSTQEMYQKALLVTNVFENGSPPTDYSKCANIGDGRGFTCGQGFTTDDGSALDPIDRYSNLIGGVDKNPFQKYRKTLVANTKGSGNACSPSRGSTDGLDGFATLWKKTSCQDPKFRQAQDASIAAEVDRYAYAHAAYAGIRSDLGQLFFRDAMVVNGDGGGEPHIGMESIMTHAKTYAPTPADAGKIGDIATEAAYLAAFLKSRRQLSCCYRPNGDLTWPKAADRMQDLGTVLQARMNTLNLEGTITLKVYGVSISKGTNVNDLAKTCANVSGSNIKKRTKSKHGKKHHKKGRRI